MIRISTIFVAKKVKKSCEMTLLQYTELSESEKMDFLQKDGAYIGKRQEGELTRVLYQLHSFYVELVYIKYRKDILDMNIDDSLSLVHPYLDQVKIKDIGKPEKESE